MDKVAKRYHEALKGVIFKHGMPEEIQKLFHDVQFDIDAESQRVQAAVDAARDDVWGDDITRLAGYIHSQNIKAGWWDKPREIGTLLMLIVSEVAEAMEGDRKGLMDDKLPHHEMLHVEIADAIIRLLDLASHKKAPIGRIVMEKLAYNRERPDHKLETRKLAGGKAY